MRKAIFGLGFFLIAACSGSSPKDDSESGSAAASGGDESSSGRSGRAGGSGKGGSSGASAGGVSTGGDPTGGTDTGGGLQGGSTGSGGGGGDGDGDTGGTSGTAGSASGGEAGLSTAGRGGQSGGGSGGGLTDPVCDPSTGDLDNTPYPDCEPVDANDACELCIQSSCCEESKVCYGYDPANVCGWGGPTSGTYGSVGEIGCYIQCARDYVEDNGAYDDSAADLCVPACTTAGCGLIGNATQDLIVCMEASCEEPCFAP